MSASPNLLVDVDRLRPGMFVQLDLGWMDHPFPRSRFRIADGGQIDTLRSLGLRRVKVRQDLSDPSSFDQPQVDGAERALPAAAANSAATSVPLAAAAPAAPMGAVALATDEARRPAPSHRERMARQRESLARSERLHGQATRAWQNVARDALQQPVQARDIANGMAEAMVTQMCEDDNTTIRMLSEAAGTAASQHAINVCVLSLMLARSMGLNEEQLRGIALGALVHDILDDFHDPNHGRLESPRLDFSLRVQGALVHDIGKQMLPDNLRNLGTESGPLLEREQREHVAHGLRLGMTMGLDPIALRIIAQHHELRDGSGLPQGIRGEEIALPARIVALVNIYDRLCNPRVKGASLRTPHEAQALLYAQMRNKLDVDVMTGFIKLLGVYPPGSVVQLSDERVGIVVSVHPAHPLRPSVLVYEPKVAPDDALILHLNHEKGLSVRRSLHPHHLPRAMLDYLSPRERVNYYFAHGLEPVDAEVAA